MHLRKKMRQGISLALVAAMSLSNAISAAAAPAAGNTNGEITVENDSYRATVDLTGNGYLGGISVSKSSDKSASWNTISETMVPGTTMFLDKDGNVRPANAESKNTMTTGNGSIGASGLEFTGELSGVKSYFMFEDEIRTLGAGIANMGDSTDTLITVVDVVPVDDNTTIALPNPSAGYSAIRGSSAPGKKWASVVDTATVAKQGGKLNRNWISMSDRTTSSKDLQWGYMLGDSFINSDTHFRFATKGTGEVQLFELWNEAGNDSYGYTMRAGGQQSKYASQDQVKPDNSVLVNSTDLQAAENKSQGVLMANKWTSGETTLSNSVAELVLNQPASIILEKNIDSETGSMEVVLTVAKPSNCEDFIDITIGEPLKSVVASNPAALVDLNLQTSSVSLKLKTSEMDESVVLTGSYDIPDAVTGEEYQLVRDDMIQVACPDGFDPSKTTWYTRFIVKDEDGNEKYLRNAGYSKYKRELQDGEEDGKRVAGDTSAEHLLKVETMSNGNAMITAKEKGIVTLVADDGTHKQHFKVEILYTDPMNLPEATDEDYAKIIESWKESLIGVGLKDEEGGMDIIAEKEAAAKTAWDAYNYKGQDVCGDKPFTDSVGSGALPATAEGFKADAVAQRKAFKKVQAMAYGYALEGSKYYKDEALFKDIINALDYLCSKCYTPRTQSNNWYASEIGVPTDLLPALMLLAEDLTQEQLDLYTEAMYFFQPDPFHGGVIGTATTQGSGYRLNQGSNQANCAQIAIGVGALRKDNEEVYLGILASSDVFVIQSVEDSTKIVSNAYTSGFYPDGSYLDHKRVPYIGGYGIDFMNTVVAIPMLIGGTCWKFSEEAQANIESYVYDGFGSSMYRGMMLDSLKGRSISRKAETNQGTGRNAMKIVLKLIDNLSDESRATMLSALKYWLEQDSEFIDTMTGIADLSAKKRAKEILEDNSIEPYVAPMHKSFPLMDRAVHRTENYLFAVSMYSERIQNTEVMNNENRMGWHQNNGMTYLYDEDRDQYSDNFWNTVNPLRLPGTTVVPVNIGNGEPDSSGWYQQGDYVSPESWVGGSAIGNYGISGMAMNGRTVANSDNASLEYAPNLVGKKSWFMFENEIVALGAGITNSGMNLPVETIIENHRLGEDGDNAFVVNGEETDLELHEATLLELVERSVDVSGTEFTGVEWAHLEGNGDSEGIGYYFPEDGAQIQARRARTTGNWSDIGTAEGESTQNYLEMWVDHGKNPSNATYSYVLLPETSADETEEYANAPKVTVLANTEKVQAVYQQELEITGINFWEDEETTLAGVTCSGQASVMLQESEDGHLKVALSDPTMKNTGSIKLTIDRPVADVIDCDDNVDYDLNEDGSVTLTFKMKGSNGYSLNAELQLEASIYPSAVTLRKGEEQAFEVRTFGEDAENVTWSVSTAETRMVSGTTIDENGVLTVAEDETDGALVVTAELESGLKLHAYVSLGKDAAIDIPSNLPEEMQAVKEIIDAALEESDDLIGYDLEAVKRAVKAVQEADSEKLAEYLSEEVLELAEAYVLTWNENDMEIGEYVETVGSAEELEPAIGTGMALSIYPSTFAASPSNAVLVITGTVEEEEASPSNATPSNATASNATKLNGKEIVEGSLSSYVLELFREYEDDEDGRRKLPMKGLIELSVSLPEHLDADKPVIAVIVDKGGKQHPVQAEVEDGTLTILITRMGTLKVANLVEEENGDEGEDAIYEIYFEDEFVGGTVTANPTSGTKGTKITLTVKADRGYKLDYLMVNGKVVTVRGNKYTFELEEDTEVKAVFKKRANVSVKDDDEDEDDDGYSSISGGSGSGGGIVYSSKDGNSWQYINGQWFAYDANGNVRTGWYLESLDGYWYYLKPNGVMATGWEYINEKWYYFNPVTIGVTGWTGSYKSWDYVAQPNPGMPQGAMYSNRMTPDGYKVDAQGAWIQ